ncbi:MAG: hypothetical protein ACPG19_13755 [Saprospiraceae bacterium]
MPTLQYPVLVMFDNEVEYFLSEDNLTLTKKAIESNAIINQQIIDSAFNVFLVKAVKNTQKLPKSFWEDLFNPLYKVELDVHFYKKTTINKVREMANNYLPDFLGTGETGKSICHSFMQELNQATTIQEFIRIIFDETA